jgi:hypothetical protein
MSLHPQTDYTVPAETAKVARAIFPKGNLCITMVDSLESVRTEDSTGKKNPWSGRVRKMLLK